MGQIGKVPESIKQRIRNKSVLNLPNNPSERGFTAETLKKRFANTVLDTDTANAIAQIDRVVDEINAENAAIEGKIKGYIREFDKDDWVQDGNVYKLTIPQSEHGLEAAHLDEMCVDFNDGSELYRTDVVCDWRFLSVSKAIVVRIDADLASVASYTGKIIIKGE